MRKSSKIISKFNRDSSLNDFYNEESFSRREVIEMCSNGIFKGSDIDDLVKEFQNKSDVEFCRLIEKQYSLKLKSLGNNKFYIKY